MVNTAILEPVEVGCLSDPFGCNRGDEEQAEDFKGALHDFCTRFVPEHIPDVLETLILLDFFSVYGVLDEGAS